MKKDSLIDFLGFIIGKILGLLFSCMPLSIALWIGRRIGDTVYLINVKRRAIAYANVKSAFSEKKGQEIKRIVKSHFENLGMSAVEILKLPFMGKRYFENFANIENLDNIKHALDRGRGIIVLSAHFGNWEIGSLAVGAKGYKISVFVREQKYIRLNSLLNRFREMTGSKVITKGFSAREIIKALHNNSLVAMLFDQDAGPNGVFVDFLGRPTSTAYGPLAFSLRTSAVILPSFMRRVRHCRHILEIGEPLELISTGDKEKDIKLNLTNAHGILESFIRRFPEQWLWSHKRWKTTPYRSVLVLSDGKAGHFNQAMAVAEMAKDALCSNLEARRINEEAICNVKVVEVRFKNRMTRVLLDLFSLFAGRRCQGCLRCLRFCLEKESFNEIKDKYADVVISCGASTVNANVFLKYENNAKNVVIMKPGLVRKKKFDLVILPKHDVSELRITHHARRRTNILVTETAPNRITVKTIKEAVLRITKDEGRRTKDEGIGLLIGGDAKGFKLKKETIEKIVSGILKIAREMDIDIFVSTSRRTSDEVSSFLKDRLSTNPRCPLLVIANEDNIEGIVPAIFGMSSLIVLSPDSISMISEAVSSGRYVVVFKESQRVRESKSQSKYERSIRNLEEQGYIKTALSDEIYDVIKRILREKPAVKRLEDREKIIERLKAII